MKAFSEYWSGRGEKKSNPQEDFHLIDADHGISIVADGVTRTVYTNGPSPAALAAQAFVDGAAHNLRHIREQISKVSMREVCRLANHPVQQVNRDLGLWDNHDYGDRDLAGTVAAILVVYQGWFIYAWITDCGIAHLTPHDRRPFITPDKLARVRENFPDLSRLSELERRKYIQRDWRNRSFAPHPTYGVITGEDDAMEYWEIDERKLAGGDTLLVFSDGARAMVDNQGFQQLLNQQHDDQLRDYVAAHNLLGDDEATLIVVRP